MLVWSTGAICLWAIAYYSFRVAEYVGSWSSWLGVILIVVSLASVFWAFLRTGQFMAGENVLGWLI